MSDNIPDWAIERACDLTDSRFVPYGRASALIEGIALGHHGALAAFARYIAEHEQEPVDPLVHEAQVIADDHGINLSAMPRVERALLAALRRGIEIATGGEK